MGDRRVSPPLYGLYEVETFAVNGDTTQKALFACTAPDAARLRLDGTWAGDTLTITLRRNLSDFLLVSRGFHWINEFPMNR